MITCENKELKYTQLSVATTAELSFRASTLQLSLGVEGRKEKASVPGIAAVPKSPLLMNRQEDPSM